MGLWHWRGVVNSVISAAAVVPPLRARITLTWQPSGSVPDQPSPIAPSSERSDLLISPPWLVIFLRRAGSSGAKHAGRLERERVKRQAGGFGWVHEGNGRACAWLRAWSWRWRRWPAWRGAGAPARRRRRASS